MIKNRFLRLTVCLVLALALAFPAGAVSFAGSGSDDDILYVSIEKSGSYYYVFVRNATAITSIDLGIYKPTGAYMIEPMNGFKDGYDDDYENNQLMYQAGTGIGFTSLNKVAIGEFNFEDSVIPKLGYVTATGIRGGFSVRVEAAIDGGGMDPDDFQAVDRIESGPSKAGLGIPLTLSGVPVPMYANNQTIAWSVKSAGSTGATITGNVLNTTGSGTAVVTATIANGKGAGVPYTQDFSIAVSHTAVTGLSQFTNYTPAYAYLELAGTVLPPDATFQEILWSMKDQGETDAVIENGFLYATKPGIAVVTATVVNGLAMGTDFKQDVNITVNVISVTDITGIPASVTAGEPCALNGVVHPEQASKKDIVWSVVNAGGTGASFVGNVLHTTSAGTVTVRATITNGNSLLPPNLDFTKTFTITVNPPAAPVELTSIAVTTPPTKATYFAGDALNLAGMVVTATYSDSSSKAVTSYTTSPANGAALNTVGNQTITVTYAENGITKTASTSVTVNPVVLESIAVTTAPTKATYFAGDALNLAGMIVTATYSDSSSKAVTSYTTNPANGATLNTAGNQTINVSYSENGVTRTATTAVTVNPVVLESIDVTTPPTKTVYVQGESLNLAGLVITATYNNDSKKAVTGYTTSPANGAILSTAGNPTVNVSYTESGVTRTTTFTVRVDDKPVVLESIAVTTPPSKAHYVGDALDLTGMVVTATYDNDATNAVTGYTTNPASGTVLADPGAQEITVTYIENGITKTATTSITVTAVALESIAVKTQPAKTTYFVGDALDLTGLVLTATNNNGSSTEVTSGYTTSPSNGAALSTAGPQTVTVTYMAKETTLTVTVNPVMLESISATQPTKTSYVEGEALDLTGMVVTATYNNGSLKAVNGYTTNPADGATLSTLGTQTITVSYAENGSTKTASFTVDVTEKPVVLESITITQPTKTEYYVGDALDLADMVVTANYLEHPSKPVTNYTTMPASGDILNTAGPQKVTVNYTENGITKSAEFSVTVTAVVLTGITATPLRTVYYVGETLDFTGMVVKAVYNNGSEKVLTEGYTTNPSSGTELNTAETITVTVSYTENGDAEEPITKTTSFDITVLDVELESIAVTKLPNKTEYFEGFMLDLFGLEVKATYNNGNVEKVLAKDYSTDPEDGSTLDTVGTQTVTVSYKLKNITETATFTVNVIEFIPVTEIKLDSKLVLEKKINTVDTPALKDYASVHPSDASIKAPIVWTVLDNESTKNTGAAISDNSTFSAPQPGTATVTATIKDGLGEGMDYYKDFDLTVYQAYTVYFYPSGGSLKGGASDHNVVIVNESIVAPDAIRANYSFNGWNTDENGTGVYYAVGSYISPTSNMALYGRWTYVGSPGGGPGGGTPSTTAIVEPAPPLTDPAGVPDSTWFGDVHVGDWFSGDVDYVYTKGLMNGTSMTQFSPNATLTRGMVVTVLYRASEGPDVSDLENPFNDVAEGTWYTAAVKWASESGIVEGYGSGKFGPNDNVTREQLAAILKRYADFLEIDLPELRGYESFSDEGSISDYAMEAVEALYKASVINGKLNNLFDSKGTATRAEFAAMLHRFLEI
ncbi:MAG: bacterial Ig-like domain-containing protein [Clostridiales bacterium]|nr:bacterial Ig-like domain-containing protein [Clostridiales bacterium]